MLIISGAPRLTAQGHEKLAEVFAKQAAQSDAIASSQTNDTDADFWRRAAACYLGASKGHAFRAAELRYDALGGMTEEQTRRRFAPGAKWTTHWTPGEVFTVRRLERISSETRVHFNRCWPSSVEVMSEGRGWRLVALAPASGERV